MELILKFDNYILTFVQEFMQSPAWDTFFSFLTKLGDTGILWIIFGAVCLFKNKYRKCGIAIFISLAVSLIVGNFVIKNIFVRIRPFIANSVQILIATPSGYSFPSSHAMTGFAAATCIWYYHKKWGVAAFVLAALTAFSRVYLYVHYPTDVLVGSALGIAFGMLAVWIAKKIRLPH